MDKGVEEAGFINQVGAQQKRIVTICWGVSPIEQYRFGIPASNLQAIETRKLQRIGLVIRDRDFGAFECSDRRGQPEPASSQPGPARTAPRASAPGSPPRHVGTGATAAHKMPLRGAAESLLFAAPRPAARARSHRARAPDRRPKGLA